MKTLISGDFVELIQAVEIFGFYLASIDMRQDSSVHEACVAELLKSAGIHSHYSELSEEEKCQLLLKELEEDPRILSATHVEKSELLEKELAIFKAARKLKISWEMMSFVRPSFHMQPAYQTCWNWLSC